MTLAARLCMAPVVQNTLLCAVSYTIFITETRPFLNAVAFQQPCKSKSFRDPYQRWFLVEQNELAHSSLPSTESFSMQYQQTYSRMKCVPYSQTFFLL